MKPTSENWVEYDNTHTTWENVAENVDKTDNCSNRWSHVQNCKTSLIVTREILLLMWPAFPIEAFCTTCENENPLFCCFCCCGTDLYARYLMTLILKVL